MAKLVALYATPADPIAFETHYFSKHLPLAKQLPGLTRYEVSSGPIKTPGGESRYHFAAILSFDSNAAMRQALRSREGQAAAADVSNFAHAGVDLLLFDSKEV